MLSVPFAVAGGVWRMWLLNYNLSVAVGFNASVGRRPDVNDLSDDVLTDAVERVRPKMMTVTAIMVGLSLIMWFTGTGSELMSRIAVPMGGCMISSMVLTLVVFPTIYALVKQWCLKRGIEPKSESVRNTKSGCSARQARRSSELDPASGNEAIPREQMPLTKYAYGIIARYQR